jgi:hypothetical protein
MKHNFSVIFFMLLFNSSFAQEKGNVTNKLSIQAYVDFVKSNTQSAAWITYDYKKISFEARYNYDWDNNVSLYAGTFLKYKDWDFRLLHGLTFGKATGLSFSPTAVMDKKKINIFNQAQYVIGLSKMPSYFLHWGEINYKPTDYIWLGITDRIYTDNTYSEIAFGPQVSFIYKNIFISFYWWVPTKQTQSNAFLLLGYEQEFKPRAKND